MRERRAGSVGYAAAGVKAVKSVVGRIGGLAVGMYLLVLLLLALLLALLLQS